MGRLYRWLLIIQLLLFSGCSPLYVLQAAYEESKILLNRQSIEKVIAHKNTDALTKEKLGLVLAARAYALEIGLTPGDSFTLYSELDEDTLAWVLMASRKDAFELKTWWFPVVGTVPYKGYFDKEHALCEASHLESQGFETRVRGTDAFSTLGWFNDPLLSTTLRREHHEIVNTVFHEILHSTVWIPGHVPFNESAANFFGQQMAIQFFHFQLSKCALETCSDEYRARLQSWLQNSIGAAKAAARLAEILSGLYHDLQRLYLSDLSSEAKISSREVVFQKHRAVLAEHFPGLQMLKTINNAEIMQLRVYMTGFPVFESSLAACGDSSECFIGLLRSVADSPGGDPFEALQKITPH